MYVCLLTFSMSKDAPLTQKCAVLDSAHWSLINSMCLAAQHDPLSSCEVTHTSDGRVWLYAVRTTQ